MPIQFRDAYGARFSPIEKLPMPETLYRTNTNLTLIGAGPVTAAELDLSLAHAPELVAADGGAETARKMGHSVLSVIGDLDSLTNSEYWRKSGITVNAVDEQDSTDFEKCLYSVEAPLILGLGFLGGRLDHQLAALSALLGYAGKRVILLGKGEICFLCPRALALELPEGTRLSLYPLVPLTGVESAGLEWPVDGLRLRPGGRLGTSNRVCHNLVRFAFDGPGMLVVLPQTCLGEAVSRLADAEPWLSAPPDGPTESRH